MTITELFDTVADAYKGDKYDTLLALQDLAETIREEGAEFGARILEHVREQALELNRCPRCLERLEEKEYREYVGEFWGAPAYMTGVERRCAACGWRE
jgi:uncharacterized protein with PIN domain